MFGLGLTEVLVLMLCGGVPLIGGIVAIVIVLRHARQKDDGTGNE